MVIYQRDGALLWNSGGERAAGRAHASLDLPASLAARPSDLYDRVFAFTCDVLGVQTVELRVATVDEDDTMR